MNLSCHRYTWPAQFSVLGWEVVGMYQRRSPYLDRIIEEFSFNNSLLTKTGFQYQDSLRTSSPGRSGGGAGNGRRACNYVSGLWISICIGNVDTKCWLAEMTLVMTSLPFARVFQCFFFFFTSALVFASRWLAEIGQLSRRGATGALEVKFKFQRRICKLSFITTSPPERPRELTRRVVLGPGSDGVESTILETKTILDSLKLGDKNRNLKFPILK